MAFTANIVKNQYGLQSIQAHVVIGGVIELRKDELAVTVGIYRSKSEYLNRMPPLETPRYIIPVAELDLSVNLRTGIYTWLMSQEYFVSPVADMADDFPVTQG